MLTWNVPPVGKKQHTQEPLLSRHPMRPAVRWHMAWSCPFSSVRVSSCVFFTSKQNMDIKSWHIYCSLQSRFSWTSAVTVASKRRNSSATTQMTKNLHRKGPEQPWASIHQSEHRRTHCRPACENNIEKNLHHHIIMHCTRGLSFQFHASMHACYVTFHYIPADLSLNHVAQSLICFSVLYVVTHLIHTHTHTHTHIHT